MNPISFLPVHALAAAFLFCATAAYSIDLTPTIGVRDLEGVKLPILRFKDGQQEAVWQAPNWPATGSAQSVILHPPARSQAEMELRLVPLKSARPPAAEQSEELEKWVRPYLAQDAIKTHFEQELSNCFTFKELSSREVIFSYVSAAQPFFISISIVELDEKTALLVMINARAKDFKPMRETAIKSMFRWDWRSAAAPSEK